MGLFFQFRQTNDQIAKNLFRRCRASLSFAEFGNAGGRAEKLVRRIFVRESDSLGNRQIADTRRRPPGARSPSATFQRGWRDRSGDKASRAGGVSYPTTFSHFLSFRTLLRSYYRTNFNRNRWRSDHLQVNCSLHSSPFWSSCSYQWLLRQQQKRQRQRYPRHRKSSPALLI